MEAEAYMIILIMVGVAFAGLFFNWVRSAVMLATYIGNKKNKKIPSIEEKYDDMEDITRIGFQETEGYIYINPKISISKEYTSLYIVFKYYQMGDSSVSRLGIKSVIINCDGERFTIPFKSSNSNTLTQRTTSGQGVTLGNTFNYTSYTSDLKHCLESAVVSCDKKEIGILFMIVSSKETKIRFEGSNGSKDCVIGPFEKKCINAMLNKYAEVIKSRKATEKK